MHFNWSRYEEIPTERRNTLQIFITTDCNCKCEGCFARKVMGYDPDYISIDEYKQAIKNFISKDGKQINLLGGEPLLHPNIKKILSINKKYNLKTTIYTNGYNIDKFDIEDFEYAKIRISFYSYDGILKAVTSLPSTNIPFDACFMVSDKTTYDDLLKSAYYLEENYNCSTFFISSIRELDNKFKDFFKDTDLTMPILDYKQIVHSFLNYYRGNMDIHISKRGVFESTKCVAGNKCRFANYFIGGKVIQCPYDIVNLKYQENYEFNKRFCKHNNTCLMSKIILRKR